MSWASPLPVVGGVFSWVEPIHLAEGGVPDEEDAHFLKI